MVLMSPAKTPTTAIARTLRDLGLAQGKSGDFVVRGHYEAGERRHTFVALLTRHADEVVAARADLIEERTDRTGFPFTVSVHYASESGRPVCDVANGAGERVREEPPTAAPVAVVAPSGAPGTDAGTCRQCGTLLIWDATGARLHDEWGEYLCASLNHRPDVEITSAVHVLAEPDQDQQPAADVEEPEPALAEVTEPQPEPADQAPREDLTRGLPDYITVTCHNPKSREWKTECSRCGEAGKDGRVAFRWGQDAQDDATNAAWLHWGEHRAQESRRAERLRERAERLRWSTAQARTMDMADDGELFHDQGGYYQMRDYWVRSNGRRVAVRRVEALIRAGLLASADAGGRVRPTRDGELALKAWRACDVEPVEKTTKQDGEDLPPLLNGDEHRRRWERHQAELAEATRRAEQFRREHAERLAREEAEEERDRQWRKANDILNPWAKAPADWTPETAEEQPEPQHQADTPQQEEPAQPALFDAAVDTPTATHQPRPAREQLRPELVREQPPTRQERATLAADVVTPVHIEHRRPSPAGTTEPDPHSGTRLTRPQRIALHTAAAHPQGHVPYSVNMRVLRSLEGLGYVEWTETQTLTLCGQFECSGDCHLGADCRPIRIAEAVKPCAGMVRISEVGRRRIAAEPREQVVIVPCGGKKAVEPYGPRKGEPVDVEQAGKMYVGSYHLATRRAADALTRDGQDGRVLILSAKYGLLPLDRWIANYDLRLSDPGSVTAETMRHQAHDLCVTGAEVTVLAGQAYAALAREALPQAVDLLAGTSGIGEQLARLAAIYQPHDLQVASATERAALSEECEQYTAACQREKETRAARQRARYVTATRLRINGHDTEASFTFTRAAGRGVARAAAAQRLAERYEVHSQFQATARGDIVLTVHGAPEQVARCVSGLPRVIYLMQQYATDTVRWYGRWERHSAAAPHLAALSAVERRAHTRQVQAQAYAAIVDRLLGPPDAVVPECDSTVPAWEQAAAYATGIATYGWFDVTAKADDAEVAELLIAEREEVTGPAPEPRPCVEPEPEPAASATPDVQLALFSASVLPRQDRADRRLDHLPSSRVPYGLAA